MFLLFFILGGLDLINKNKTGIGLTLDVHCKISNLSQNQLNTII